MAGSREPDSARELDTCQPDSKKSWLRPPLPSPHLCVRSCRAAPAWRRPASGPSGGALRDGAVLPQDEEVAGVQPLLLAARGRHVELVAGRRRGSARERGKETRATPRRDPPGSWTSCDVRDGTSGVLGSRSGHDGTMKTPGFVGGVKAAIKRDTTPKISSWIDPHPNRGGLGDTGSKGKLG